MMKLIKSIYLKTLHKIPIVGRTICFISVLLKGVEELELDKNKLNIICAAHIGEIYYICALSRLISEKYNKGINLIISEKYSGMQVFFNYDCLSFQTAKEITMQRLARLGSDARFFVKKYDKEFDVIVDNTTNEKRRQIKAGYNIIDLMLEHYNIEVEHDKLLTPKLKDIRSDECAKKLSQMKLDKGNTVVIFPEALSCPTFYTEEWLSLAELLEGKGYDICFNTKNAKFSKYPTIFGGLEETINALNYCGNFISIRSGICDLVQNMDIKKIVIYPKKKHYRDVSPYDIYNLKWSENLIELEVDTLSEVIKQF